ncbi:MAG: L-rhamnose isomerase [Succinivibrio sp.]|nr:L-rhamnose isomerase [Succinivibrio sp.]
MNLDKAYALAKEMYAEYGIDTDQVISKVKSIPLSLHCWQIDDVHGFETSAHALSGGIATFGNAGGLPQNKEEYFERLTKAVDLVPGKKKINVHAIYLDAKGETPERDAIEPENFKIWVDYAKQHGVGLDFNPTYFSHPKAASGFTLSSADDKVREFWIEHGKRSRKVGEYFGRELGERCITNHWIPDGYKDKPIDELGPRQRLIEAYNEIFKEQIDPKYNIDAVESKLFGLGSESYVTGSHEFYLNYVNSTRKAIITLDCGHFHPTEVVSAKLSSMLAFNQEVMLHVSRPVRWDSDHVVLRDDETRAVMLAIARNDAFDKIHVGTDWFDASIDRVAATAIGARAVRKCMVEALLEPTAQLKQLEAQGNYTARLALVEELKDLPSGIVFDELCAEEQVPNREWLKDYL